MINEQNDNWLPENGFTNISFQNTLEAKRCLQEQLVKGEKVVGFTVHPNQYSAICEFLQE